MNRVLRLLALTRGRRGEYGAAIAALTLGTIFFLSVPRNLGLLVAMLPHASDPRVGVRLYAPAMNIAALLMLQGVCTAVYGYLVANASERIANGLRAAFFRNLVSRPLDECSPRQLGEVASAFSSDLGVIQGGLSDTLISFLRHSIFTVGAIVALFFVDLRMTMISLGGVALIAVVILAFIRLATAAVVAVQRYRGRTVSLLLEAASNAYVIQAYDRVDYMDARFVERLDETFARVRRHLRLMTLMNPVSLVVFAVVICGTLAFGLSEVRTGRLGVADLVAYITYAVVLVASVSQIGVLAGRLQQAGAMLEKHESLLSPAPAAGAGPLFPPVLHGAASASSPSGAAPFGYVLDGVGFGYPGTEHPALVDVSFEIPAGRMTAIVGESGAGKSTVAGLLCGIYRPASGVLRFAAGPGEGPGEAPPSRREVAVVPQEPFLFAGTVAENIGFGREWVTQGDVERAARAAQIHEHVHSLPGGYEAGVDEGGRNFSRGQRQRIALARALAARPRILILDEATASLDVVSERAIKSAIRALHGQVTIVVIAHNGELLTEVDHLVVLDRGRVVHAAAPGDATVTHDLFARLTQVRRARLVEA
ncbi:MAG TPA: ABC transporter ATP-binding protein [Longimicrobiaceae bacterium]|nr:ABC transporter ATP-binding protein [Longimicrobiaceae bacterium]